METDALSSKVSPFLNWEKGRFTSIGLSPKARISAHISINKKFKTADKKKYTVLIDKFLKR